MRLRILSVNVGKPRLLGTFEGETVLSGFHKDVVTADTLFVTTTNIEGDGQADLRVHGGADKAVYSYPADHWRWWETEKHLPCSPGTFGENLTLEGADEDAVSIGDRFRWGAVLLEVSQPRAPCFKFAMHARRADAPQIMTVSARCGWYLRVIEEGTAAVNGAALVREYESGAPSVRDAFRAVLHPGIPLELCRRVHDTPQLAEAWRKPLAKKLAAA
jgi:MOSC domain-containing protein YiiM